MFFSILWWWLLAGCYHTLSIYVYMHLIQYNHSLQWKLDKAMNQSKAPLERGKGALLWAVFAYALNTLFPAFTVNWVRNINCSVIAIKLFHLSNRLGRGWSAWYWWTSLNLYMIRFRNTLQTSLLDMFPSQMQFIFIHSISLSLNLMWI